MKFLIISPEHNKAESMLVLEKEMLAIGHTVIWGTNIEDIIKHQDSDLAYMRCWFIHHSAEDYSEAMLRLNLFEVLGGKPLNSSRGIIKSHHKILSGELLSNNNMPVPKTYLTSNSELEGTKWIFKPDRGTRGRGMEIFDNPEKAKAKLENNIGLLQEFHPGKTYRIVASKTELLYAIGKETEEDIASTANGAERIQMDLKDFLEYEDIILQTLKVLDLGLAGVDLLIDKQGNPYIPEANHAFMIHDQDQQNNRLLVQAIDNLASS